MQRVLMLAVAVAVLAAAVVFLLVGGDDGGPGAPIGGGTEVGAVEPEVRRAGGDQRAEVRRDVLADEPARAPEPEERSDGAALVVEVVAADGGPVAGMTVVAYRDRIGQLWPARRTAVTGADGIATFMELDAGRWGVRTAIRARGGRAVIVPGRTARLRIEITDGVTVRGRVEDPSGHPIAGAAVWLSESGYDQRGAIAGRTGADGTFELSGVHRWQAVAAWAEGYAASPVHPVTVESGVRNLRIVLSPVAGGVVGRVVDHRGRAVDGATVLVGADQRPADRRAADGSRVPGPAPREAWTDAAGKFEVGHLEPGEQPIQAAAPGFAPFVGEVDVQVGTRAEIEVVLKAGATLVGVCRDGGGAPLGSADVETVGMPVLARRYAYSGSDGSYRMEDLPIGEVELRASVRGSAGAPATTRIVTTPGATVRWDPVLVVEEVDPREEVSGRVVGTDGRGISEYRVVAEPDPPQRAPSVSRITNGEDGAFRMAVPWPRVRLLVFSNVAGHGFPVAHASGIDRGTSGVELVVDRQAFSGLRARVVDVGGAPVGATLQIWHGTARIWREVASQPGSGLVEVSPMPPGECTLELRSSEHPWLRLGERELLPGRILDLGDLVLQPGGRIEGSATFVDGGAPSGLTLRFVDEDAGREVGVAEVRDGRFRSNPLPLANLVMVVEGDGIAATRLPVPLDAATPLRVVELSVARGVPVTLRLSLPPGMERPAWLNVGVFREREAVWTRGVGRAASLEVVISLAPGSYRALVQTEQPLADVAFEVHGQPVTVDLPLAGR